MAKSYDEYRLGEPYEPPRHKGLKVIAIMAALMAITIVPAMAAKGGAGGGGKGGSGGSGGTTTATGSFDLVLLDSSDATPNYGEHVTFNVTSTASYPSVTLTCYQAGSTDWVTNQTVGFYSGWVWSQVFPLSSWKWTSGAADCNAVLFYQTSKGTQTLATKSFHVDP
jgi:hypothetical protein